MGGPFQLTRRGFLTTSLSALLSKVLPPLGKIDAYSNTANRGQSKLATFLLSLGPAPASLGRVRGIHPRIFLNDSRIATLRQDIMRTHAHLWIEVREQAERAVRTGPPAYQDDGDPEQLWQRPVGNTMPVLAMAYLLTGEQRYLESARQWALASCGYRTWGLGRQIDGLGLAAGHQLFGLGIVYDWCHKDLDGETRRIIRETLVKRTPVMFEATRARRIWWHNYYLQNHLWVNISGMAVAGLAVFDEVEEGLRWIDLSLDKLRRTMAALGPDGASHEGVAYWGYGVEYMLKFMHLARELLDTNLYDHGWWRNTATYRQYLALPRNAWARDNNIVDIADCPRRNWYGPDYLLRGLAREYRDGYAQWLAHQIDEANIDSPDARWLNLVWFDPTLEAKPPQDRPTLHHFEDMGIVSARSDWSGNESLVVFKCGPFIGHKAVQEFAYNPGGGHMHPDANHFVLFGEGEWLIRDDGYCWKWTRQHNTLLADGKGQLGEGTRWFDGREPLRLKSRPRVVRAASTANLDHMVGDATDAYPREIGLRRYVRHLLFLRPNVLIVADDIVIDGIRELELRFHPEQRAAGRDGKAFLFRGTRAVLRLEPLTDSEVSATVEDVDAVGIDGERVPMFAVRLKTRRAQWRNAVALSWARTGASPATVALRTDGDIWAFAVGDRSVLLDWATGEALIRR